MRTKMVLVLDQLIVLWVFKNSQLIHSKTIWQKWGKVGYPNSPHPPTILQTMWTPVKFQFDVQI